MSVREEVGETREIEGGCNPPKIEYITGTPAGVSLKSLRTRTLQCGVPFERKALLPSSSMIMSVTQNAKPNARATSKPKDNVSFQTFSTVFHIFSMVASVLL
jgi:hypothetical protein